ncbi:hypothetical protein A2U01_0067565, partial [Trifolium medium]|nr:hypothetical protein [Trifolium medium]
MIPRLSCNSTAFQPLVEAAIDATLNGTSRAYGVAVEVRGAIARY